MLSVVLAAWPSVYVRPAMAQFTGICAALDPARGGAPAVSVNYVTLDLQPGDAVTMVGTGVVLVVQTPAEGASSTDIDPVIQANLTAETPEPTNTFIATSAGTHHLGALETGGVSLLTGSFTCSVFDPQTPQATTSSIMIRQMSHILQAGVSLAVAERFSPVVDAPPQIVVKGYSASAHASLRSLAAAADALRAHRLSMYDAPETEALDAIETALAADGSEEDNADGRAIGNDEVFDPVLGFTGVTLGGLPREQPASVNAWARGSFTHVDGDAVSGNTWNGIVGIDYLVTDHVLVGLLGGLESGDLDFDVAGGATDGTGYTAGAYVGVQLSEQLTVEAFLTHSWLDYDTVVNTATGSTDASRVMVSANLIGNLPLSESLIFEPNMRLFYAHELQDGYTLSNGELVGRNTIDSGRISIGPKLHYFLNFDDGTNWSMFVSAHGEYDFSSEMQTVSTLPDFDGLLSARLGLGMNGVFRNGWSISLAGDVGGLGSGNFITYTGTGRLRIPFN